MPQCATQIRTKNGQAPFGSALGKQGPAPTEQRRYQQFRRTARIGSRIPSLEIELAGNSQPAAAGQLAPPRKRAGLTYLKTKRCPNDQIPSQVAGSPPRRANLPLSLKLAQGCAPSRLLPFNFCPFTFGYGGSKIFFNDYLWRSP